MVPTDWLCVVGLARFAGGGLVGLAGESGKGDELPEYEVVVVVVLRENLGGRRDGGRAGTSHISAVGCPVLFERHWSDSGTVASNLI